MEVPYRNKGFVKARIEQLLYYEVPNSSASGNIVKAPPPKGAPLTRSRLKKIPTATWQPTPPLTRPL